MDARSHMQISQRIWHQFRMFTLAKSNFKHIFKIYMLWVIRNIRKYLFFPNSKKHRIFYSTSLVIVGEFRNIDQNRMIDLFSGIFYVKRDLEYDTAIYARLSI